MGLKEYHRKRDFKKTSEPKGSAEPRRSRKKLLYIIQKHAATRLHYDFRLEMQGVLKSWAVPKGPSLDLRQKRLAVHVEDHPIEYGRFEGVIPKGEYGGGTVLLWDRGTWIPEGDPEASYRRGKMEFRLEGQKLQGGWALVRMQGEDGKNWLLFKRQDEFARAGHEITEEMPLSVASDRSLEEIAKAPGKMWRSNRETPASPSERRTQRLLSKRPATLASKAESAPPKIAAHASSPTHRASQESLRPSRSAKPAARGKSRTMRAKGARNRPVIDMASLPGVRRGALPREPPSLEMATLVAEIPQGDEWLHEIKYDGYRMVCILAKGRARLFSRNRKDWTERFRPLAGTIEAWPARSAILDGEAVVLDEGGVSDFQRLQNTLSGGGGEGLVYYLFDLLHLDGWDLRAVPLESRKTALQTFLESVTGADERVRYSDHVLGKGEEFYRHACRFGLEGLVSKRRESLYRSGRHRDWLKTKCLRGQELVIGGYTDPAGSRLGLGALLLGYYDAAKGLVYAGRVGTGFTQRSLNEIHEHLRRLEQKAPAFTNPPSGRGLHWVKPVLVAEVEFQEWTREGLLRHPRFRGMREDKPATEVVREIPLRGSKSISRSIRRKNNSV